MKENERLLSAEELAEMYARAYLENNGSRMAEIDHAASGRFYVYKSVWYSVCGRAIERLKAEQKSST